MQIFVELIVALIDIINKNQVVGVLVIVLAAMAYWIEKRTVPMMSFQNKLEQLDQMHADLERVDVTLNKLYVLEERQIGMQEELFKRLDNHTAALANLSQDVKLISYEVNWRRLDSPEH